MAPVAVRDYEEWQRQAQSFDRIVAYRPQGFIVNSGGEPERVRGERVARGYFRCSACGRCWAGASDQQPLAGRAAGGCVK